ncbi:MAG: class I SAM-dependent methyltransferase [bacterium]|nr:class I SAM-dependent methyltransferase [bacterium]
MNLASIITRETPPEPWSTSGKIPWDDPEFSRRMLDAHLSQDHDLASRRLELVERQVSWLSTTLLNGRPSRILDLGCGPGLYAHRLASLGHTCTGIDFGPASIDYAQAQACEHGLTIDYRQEDLRTAEFGKDYDLVMFIWAEFNAFRPGDARDLLRKCRNALAPGGTLLLETHALDSMRTQGEQGPSWYSAQEGLWSSEPHICLQENFWNEDQLVSTTRFYILDAGTGSVTEQTSTAQGYTDTQFAQMLTDSGLAKPVEHPSLTGNAEDASPHCRVFTTCQQD